MTPEQISIVEGTLRDIGPDLPRVAADFYQRLFAAAPQLRGLFGVDPADQHRKFAEQLAAIGSAIRDFDAFVARTEDLGLRHRSFGVRAADYASAGPPLLAALRAWLLDGWTTEVEEAWRRGYNLTVEAMTEGTAPP